MHLDSKTIDILKFLHQTNVDILVAYENALLHILNENWRSNLLDFEFAHNNKLREFEVYLQRNNLEPPKRSKDVKGYLYEALTTMRGMMGDKQILKTLYTLEEQAATIYQEALQEISYKDPVLLALIERALRDEQKYMAFYTVQLEADFDHNHK